MNNLTKLTLVICVWLGSMASAFALEPVYSDFFGKAIKGYDPVSYFLESKAVKGNSDITYEWKGAEWNFSSQDNLNLFVANPQKYAPMYGGYCAWAVSRGYTAKIDPNAWYIFEDKLYLNYSKSVQEKWQQDIKGNIIQADKNWPTLLSE